jgi:hypothetical protein
MLCVWLLPPTVWVKGRPAEVRSRDAEPCRLETDYVLYLSEVFEEVQVSRIIFGVTFSRSVTTAMLVCSPFHGGDHEMVFHFRSVPCVPPLRTYVCVRSFIERIQVFVIV